MFKRIVFVFLGIVIGASVVALVEAISHQIYPIPPGLSLDNLEAYEDYIFNQMPIGAMLFVILAHSIGSFFGSFITAKLCKDKPSLGMIIGLVLMMFGIITSFLITHPTWMIIADLACYLPASFMGVKFAKFLNRR